MSRPRFQRTVQNPLGMPGAAVLAATIAVAVLANGAICTAVHAQQRDPVDQRRLEAPIGHRQPRPQDLPSRAPQDENNARDVNRNFDVSPEINICRGCWDLLAEAEQNVKQLKASLAQATATAERAKAHVFVDHDCNCDFLIGKS
jgi:hypothetical protein